MDYALIVIDLIEDYFDSSIWPQSAIPAKRGELTAATNELVALCRLRGLPIVWIRQEFRGDMSDAFAHARRAGMQYAKSGTPGASLLTELNAEPSDTVITKTRFSAFYGTDLDSVLREEGVSGLILAGITTAWCVRSTAVDGYQRDYDVILASDCTAAFDDRAHRESLAAMEGYIATCLTNEELRQRI